MIEYFTFKNTYCESILNEMWIEHFAFDTKTFTLWVEFIPIDLLINRDFVVWFGDYSWSDSSKLKIESYCDNKFRNMFYKYDINKKYSLTLPPKVDKNFTKIGVNWMGNWFCNITCCLISELIVSRKLNSKLIFIHVPKGLCSDFVKNFVFYLDSYLYPKEDI